MDERFTTFQHVAEAGTTAYLRVGEASWLLEAGILFPDRLTGSGGGARGSAAMVDLGGRQRCFLKQYFRGSFLLFFFGDRYLSSARFLRELAAYERLEQQGVAVPRVLALVIKRRGIFRRAWLLSELVDGYRALGAFLREASSRDRRYVLRQAGAAVRAMHTAGVLHPDLTVENIRVGPEGEILLLDFDRCARSTNGLRRWLNVFRLHRSAVKSGLWRSEGTGQGPGAPADSRERPEGTRSRERLRERYDMAAFLAGYLARGPGRPRLAALLFAAYRLWERAHAFLWKTSDA